MTRFKDKSYFRVASSKKAIKILNDDEVFDISSPSSNET